ncbi:MAG: hypothetical protein LAO30_06760 [Acidobacteriia bacterium]|nr:hypothetical protein [Terriglobia bacterium]
MFARRSYKLFTILTLLGIVPLLAAIATGQESSTALLRLQRSKAYLNLETNVVHAQGMHGITYGKGGDVASYPNSLSCLTVYGDGKYVLEKREEMTVGKPKVKLAEGTLGADDLQHLKAILDDENLKNIVSPKAPNIPDNATIREIESVDAQIDHAGTPQHLTTIKERLKMGASETGGATNGMDTYLDNASSFQKTLNPLMKWFEGMEKKSKSDLKDAKPQYCAPMNIG